MGQAVEKINQGKQETKTLRYLRYALITVPLMVILIFGGGNTVVSAAPGDSPHAQYLVRTTMCKSCHLTHTGAGAMLINQITLTGVCFTCHDGSGSSFNIKPYFAPVSQGGLAQSSYHQVKDTGNNYPNGGSGAVQCTDCHNPHGEKDGSGNVYPRLLRSFGANQGNSFCYSCHGSTPRSFSGDPSYYARTAGNHSTANSAHYDTSFSILLPVAGTQITCDVCHNKHSGSNSSLLDSAEENLCLSCHNNAANSRSPGENVQLSFNPPAGGSRHDIYGTSGSKVECTSCHGPHSVSKTAANSLTSDISDPFNTKRAFLLGGGTTVTDFCLKCHTPAASAKPVKITDPSTLVPYTVVFSPASLALTTVNNANGWDKTGYKNSSVAHFVSNLTCNSCHVPHGSSNSRLQNTEDTVSTAGVCTSCHQSAGSGGSAPDVRSDLTKTYNHATLTISGKHSDTEQYSAFPSSGGNRHAECADCHDSHAAQMSVPTTAPNLQYSLKNVSGVNFSGTNTAWSDPVLQLVSSVTAEYQLCLKCHSKYSYGTSIPTNPSGGTQTNIPQEFNPSNPSYHSVAGASKANTGYGGYINGWSASSRMYCTDCHRSVWAPTVGGPHGSTNKWILAAPYDPATVGTSGTSTQLCFRCHDFNLYAGTSYTGTAKTGFSASNGTTNYHTYSAHRAQGCTRCHTPIPHGYKNDHLLAPRTDAAPYNSQNLVINGAQPASGNWSQNSCTHSSQLTPCS